jgi:PAS domain S-box-containing protein
MGLASVPSHNHVSLQPRKNRRDSVAHVVRFYTDDSSYLDTLHHSVEAVLKAGDAAVIIATEAHRNGLTSRLNASGLDLARAIEDGRYALLDAAETLSRFMSGGMPDPASFAEIIGIRIAQARKATEKSHGRVSAFGEMVAVLWAEGKFDAAVALEQLWNQLAETHSFGLQCAYPMKGFGREEHGEYFLKICGEHSAIVPDVSCTSPSGDQDNIFTATYLQQTTLALKTEKMERIGAEKLLRRREAELAELLENAPEGVYQTGPDQKILWANKALSRLFGYAEEEYIGQNAAAFYVQDDALPKLWEKLMGREEVYNFAAEIRCKDGATKHVLIHANGLWEEGQLVRARYFIHDITAQKEMESALRKAHDELEMRVVERTAELEQKNLQIREQAETLKSTNQGLRDLSARLLHVQDEERRHIARDLHDSTGQTLALLTMTLSALESEVRKLSPELAKGLADNAELVRQVSVELRTLSYLLHPPLLDEVGLGSALHWFVDGFGKRSGILVNLELPGNLGRMPRDLETAIYRVVQECLTNIHRHSQSPVAAIRLSESARRIVLEVTDQGKGIDQHKLSRIASSCAPGVGLRGIRERIQNFRGELEITSDAKGTRIKVVIPTNDQPLPRQSETIAV